jgi:hypothetical protein
MVKDKREYEKKIDHSHDIHMKMRYHLIMLIHLHIINMARKKPLML